MYEEDKDTRPQSPTDSASDDGQTNYKYGFMGDDRSSNSGASISDESSADNEEENEGVEGDNFTEVEMPGEAPTEDTSQPSNNEERKESDFSFELQTDEDELSDSEVSTPDESSVDTSEGEEGGKDYIENESSDYGVMDDMEDEEYNPVAPEETEEPVPTSVSEGQAEVIKKILNRITDEIEQIKKILPGADVEISDEISTSPDVDTSEEGGNKIVEGVFDGEGMVGSDGKHYDIPANYASKSKLVEGDILKLTISPDGSFLFKQIGPSERNRLVGTLAYDPTQGRYLVVVGEKKYYILTASVTYFKGKPGDETVILVPKSTPSRWAAVENIITKKEAGISDIR